MRKKTMFFTIILVFSMFTVSVFGDTNHEPSDWAKEDIAKVLEIDLIPKDFLVSFQQEVTREEYCEIAMYFIACQYGYELDTLLGIQLYKGYSDFNITHYFLDTRNPLINAAYQLEIVSGTSLNLFSPERLVTRQEAAVMLYNTYLRYGATENGYNFGDVLPYEKGVTILGFSDDAAIAPWAEEGIYYLNQFGVMTGTDENKFDPEGYYTREQCIATFLRMYENAPASRLHGNIPPYMTDDSWQEELNPLEQELKDGAEITEVYETADYTITLTVRGGMPHGPERHMFIQDKEGTLTDLMGELPPASPWGNGPYIENISIDGEGKTMYFEIDCVKYTGIDDNTKPYHIEYELNLETLELKELEVTERQA